jgi:hypothetical protein
VVNDFILSHKHAAIGMGPLIRDVTHGLSYNEPSVPTLEIY